MAYVPARDVVAVVGRRFAPEPLEPSARLVNTTDEKLLDQAVSVDTNENIALSAVVKKGASNPTIALRCNSSPGDRVTPFFSKITAFEVGTVTGP
jgi:hypothetical protein